MTGEDRQFLREVVLPANDLWLAESAGALAGFIAFSKGWVNHLYVAPEFQGRGAGTALLDLAKTSNPSLQLWAFEANTAAIDFYRRRGFHVVERTDGAATEAKRPDVRMGGAGPTSEHTSRNRTAGLPASAGSRRVVVGR